MMEYSEMLGWHGITTDGRKVTVDPDLLPEGEGEKDMQYTTADDWAKLAGTSPAVTVYCRECGCDPLGEDSIGKHCHCECHADFWEETDKILWDIKMLQRALGMPLLWEEGRENDTAYIRHTNELYGTDRISLIDIFRKFRASFPEVSSNHPGRDELERKLREDGDLSQLDIHLLITAVNRIVADLSLQQYYRDVLFGYEKSEHEPGEGESGVTYPL